MDDYYSLLGIDADASVDDIRGAYRVRKDGLDTASDSGKADAAKLNKAWNVLSDPYQRGRYDQQRAAAAESGTLGADEDDDDRAARGHEVPRAEATHHRDGDRPARVDRARQRQSDRRPGRGQVTEAGDRQAGRRSERQDHRREQGQER